MAGIRFSISRTPAQPLSDGRELLAFTMVCLPFGVTGFIYDRLAGVEWTRV